MKNYRLFTRSSIVGVSLVMVSTLLPLNVFAKKSSTDSTSSETSTSDSTSSKKSSTEKTPKTKKEKTVKEKTTKAKHSEKKSKHEETNTSSTSSTSTSGTADQKSDEVLHQVSNFYVGLKTWKTRLIQKLVASSETKTVELLSVVDVSVKQPDMIALNLRAGMPGGSMYCDGKDAYFYSQILNKYNVKPATELEKLFSDSSSRYVNGPYAMYSLLPSLIGKDPYSSIMAGVKKVEYAGVEDVDGTPCHHLRFTQANFNWDLWVDSGKNPWIVKVSPDAAEEKPEKTEKSPMVGKDAPTFKLALTDGKEFDLSKHKNKDVVVIDFWASWCPPCRESLPILTKVTKSFRGEHVVFYPINVGEDIDKVKNYLSKANLDVTAALDTDRKVSELYGVNGIPQTVIIDKNGVIQVLDVGYSSDMEKRITSDLDALVKNKSAK
ncbi:MAG: redoxin family protein [Candidatus Melainabacteria bacterium]|nr:redoxin family protein [Candidatus Melainabacteria bacterium]